jgi:hypothetical protein
MGARQSERVLALAQHLLDSVNYFAPHPASVAAWRGGYPIGFAALGVSDTGAFNLRLEQEQVAPVVALAAAVAPALDFLRQPFVTPAMISSPKLVSEWRALVANADPSQPGSTLGSLVQYLRTTMGPIDQPSCQVASLQKDAGPNATDWFSMRRRQMRAAMLGRCHPGGSGDAVAAYDKLRALFQARLAGKFPFVDTSKAAAAPDADPAAVREVYQAYDAFAKSADVMLRSDPRAVGPAKNAFGFLDQLAAARPFFAAFVDSGATRKAPEFAFTVDPIGAGQAAELHTGTRVTLLNDSTQSGVWGFGEPVRITAPGDTSSSFRSTGWWGLVELGELQSRIHIRYYQPDTKVRLDLPVFPTTAPAIPGRR